MTTLAITDSDARSFAHENGIVIDALPYYDQGYDDTGVQEAAMTLVEEEMRRYRPTKNYLNFLPPPEYHVFDNASIKTEFDRLQKRLPMELLSMKRYELPAPGAGKITDVAAWTEAVENSQAQLEHQALRINNLDLMTEYGAALWRQYNQTLIKMVENAQHVLHQIRADVQDTNVWRKEEQLTAGSKLKRLEENWVTLVSNNYEIERACAALERDIEKMKVQSTPVKSKSNTEVEEVTGDGENDC